MFTNVNYFLAFYVSITLFPFVLALVLGVGGAMTDRLSELRQAAGHRRAAAADPVSRRRPGVSEQRQMHLANAAVDEAAA